MIEIVGVAVRGDELFAVMCEIRMPDPLAH
jgi:hypothetical protein